MRILSWNLYHGRDFPPDRSLFTWRSRLFRVTERNETHVQVNRPLREEFIRLLSGLEWDVALLQEAPPRWFRPLGTTLGASGALALTSRNFLSPRCARSPPASTPTSSPRVREGRTSCWCADASRRSAG